MQPALKLNQTNKAAPVDGVIRRPQRHPTPQEPARMPEENIAKEPAVTPAVGRPAQRQATYKEQKPWRKRLELPLLIIAGIIGGFLVQTAWFGVPVVLAYGLYALIFRVPSRTTFTLAALSLVAVSTLLLFKPDMQLASNFTTYTFLLLVIGVITLTIEGRPIRRKRRHRNRR